MSMTNKFPSQSPQGKPFATPGRDTEHRQPHDSKNITKVKQRSLSSSTTICVPHV